MGWSGGGGNAPCPGALAGAEKQTAAQGGAPQPTNGGPPLRTVWEKMTDWFQAKISLEYGVPDGHLHVIRHLRQIIFKQVKHPVPADIFAVGDLQPAAEPMIEGVVSEAYTACRVKNTVKTRDAWLRQRGLPLNTLMNDSQRQAFVADIRNAYQQEPHQRFLQQRDRQEAKPQLEKYRKKSRWARTLQRRCGTKALCEVISFSGRLLPDFLDDVLEQGSADPDGGALQPTANGRKTKNINSTERHWELVRSSACRISMIGCGGKTSRSATTKRKSCDSMTTACSEKASMRPQSDLATDGCTCDLATTWTLAAPQAACRAVSLTSMSTARPNTLTPTENRDNMWRFSARRLCRCKAICRRSATVLLNPSALHVPNVLMLVSKCTE